MNLFKKLFKKSKSIPPNNEVLETPKTLDIQEQIAISDSGVVIDKIDRQMSNQLKKIVEQSSLNLHAGQLYMHYSDGNFISRVNEEAKEDQKQEWKNKFVFFWKENEPFPRKGLPEYFERLDKKLFMFNDKASNLELQVGRAMPWFEMPGLGEKFFCMENEQEIPIPELNRRGLIDYVVKVELNETNIDILTKQDQYFFLIDATITPFHNGKFYLEGQPVQLAEAYNVGGVHILQRIYNKQHED